MANEIIHTTTTPPHSLEEGANAINDWSIHVPLKKNIAESVNVTDQVAGNTSSPVKIDPSKIDLIPRSQVIDAASDAAFQDHRTRGLNVVKATGAADGSPADHPPASIEDAQLGQRNILESTVLGATPSLGFITVLFGRIGRILKELKGTAHWYDPSPNVPGTSNPTSVTELNANALRRDGSVLFTGDLQADGHRIQGLPDVIVGVTQNGDAVSFKGLNDTLATRLVSLMSYIAVDQVTFLNSLPRPAYIPGRGVVEKVVLMARTPCGAGKSFSVTVKVEGFTVAVLSLSGASLVFAEALVGLSATLGAVITVDVTSTSGAPAAVGVVVGVLMTQAIRTIDNI